MTDKEALKLALDAIEVYSPDYMHGLPKKYYVQAIKEALEKPSRDWVSLEDEEVIRLAKHYRHAPITLIGTVESLFKDMNHG